MPTIRELIIYLCNHTNLDDNFEFTEHGYINIYHNEECVSSIDEGNLLNERED